MLNHLELWSLEVQALSLFIVTAAVREGALDMKDQSTYFDF